MGMECFEKHHLIDSMNTPQKTTTATATTTTTTTTIIIITSSDRNHM